MSAEWPDFSTLDWEDLYPRLLLLTYSRLRRNHWAANVSGEITGVRSAQDFVQEAVTKALSGTRNFDPTRTVFENFAQIISSEISNALTSAKALRTKRLDDIEVLEIPSLTASPEEFTIEKNQIERLIKFIRDNDDETAAAIADHILKGDGSLHEIARIMGLSLAQADSAKKRLQRHVSKFSKISSDLNFVQQRERLKGTG